MALPKLPNALPRMPRRSARRGNLGPALPRFQVTGESQRAWWAGAQQRYSVGFGSLLEAIVFDYFIRYKRWRRGVQFEYQKALDAPGLFAITPFTRSDFVVAVPYAAVNGTAVVLDPYVPYTHRDVTTDRAKRDILAAYGVVVVYLRGDDIEGMSPTDPYNVVERGLRGIDISGRLEG